MKGSALVLKQYGYDPDYEDGVITFKKCPLCRSEDGLIMLTNDGFTCTVCTDQHTSVSEFYKQLNIPFDASPINFPDLVLEDLSNIFDTKRTMGKTSGYPSLDGKTDGVKPAHLYILAAETGMGKSVFAINLMVNLIKKTNTIVSYYDLENGRNAAYQRFLMIYGNKSKSFFTNPKNDAEAMEIVQGLNKMLYYRDHNKLAAFIEKSQGVDLAQSIGELIRTDVNERGVSFVCIDPLEEFEPAKTDYNSTGSVVRYFKNLAQELNITILILHHIIKPSDRKSNIVTDINPSLVPKTQYRIPTIHDLLGSSKITNIATDVWVIVRQKDGLTDTEKGRTLLRILKQRESSNAGDVYLVLDMQTLRFSELYTWTSKEVSSS